MARNSARARLAGEAPWCIMGDVISYGPAPFSIHPLLVFRVGALLYLCVLIYRLYSTVPEPPTVLAHNGCIILLEDLFYKSNVRQYYNMETEL